MRASCLPVQIQPQHGDAHVAQDLDGFEDCGLVCVEFFGNRPDVLFAADAEEGKAGAEGFEGFYSTENIISNKANEYG